jgi:hypothetical protein
MGLTVYTRIIENLENDLNNLKEEGHTIFVQAEKAISLCKMTYLELQSDVKKKDFETEADEIHFFKHLKPRLCCKMTFYRKLATIESHRPKYARKVKKEYLQKEIFKLHNFFEDHSDFIEYYRSGQILHDDKFFTRNIEDLILGNHNYEYIVNPDFATVYDTILSKVLAYEKLEKYLDNEIWKLEIEKDDSIVSQPVDEWTGKLTYFAELVYGIKESGVINNGNSSVTELIELFSRVFKLPPGNVFNAFRSVYSRKTNPLIFINKMQESLLQRINEKFK